MQANQGCVHADISGRDDRRLQFRLDHLVKTTDTNVRDVSSAAWWARLNTIMELQPGAERSERQLQHQPHCLSNDGTSWPPLSDATNLVAGDTNGVRDGCPQLLRRTTVIASMDSNGTLGDGESGRATIDASGDRVAFSSLASNLVYGSSDSTRDWDVFIRYVSSAETDPVSVGTSHLFPNGDSSGSTISPDGNFVQFGSNASDLVKFDANGIVRDVFMWNLNTWTDKTTFVSALPPDGEGNDYSLARSISANGRYVAFESVATNLVPFDNNGHQDVFVADRTTGAIVRVSVSSTGAEGNGDSVGGSLSGDGRFVACQLRDQPDHARHDELAGRPATAIPMGTGSSTNPTQRRS